MDNNIKIEQSESLRAYVDQISNRYFDKAQKMFEKDKYSCPCLIYDEHERDYTFITLGTQNELEHKIIENPHLIAISVKQFEGVCKKGNETSRLQALEEMKTILYVDLMYRYKRVEYQNNENKLIQALRKKNGLPYKGVCETFRPPKIFEGNNYLI
ncbi:hypothetical protein ABEP12_02135 [Bacillus velezensis]